MVGRKHLRRSSGGKKTVENSRPFAMSDKLIPIVFRYYIAMNLARQTCQKHLKDENVESVGVFLVTTSGIMMSYWYGMLYVVIEGWRQTGLTDTEIDELLESSNTERLWNFRNGIFHFQQQFLPDKQKFLFKDPSFARWVNLLSEAFKRRLNTEMERINADA